MNLITGALLTCLDEEDAFWVLVSLIENRLGYYCKSMCGLQVGVALLLEQFRAC